MKQTLRMGDWKNIDYNKKITSSGCGSEQPIYRKGKGICIEVTFPLSLSKDSGDDTKQKLPAKRVEEIFSRISDDDLSILGFNKIYSRPSWLLISNGPTLEGEVKSAVFSALLPVVLTLAILSKEWNGE